MPPKVKRGRKPKSATSSVYIEFEKYVITGAYGDFNVMEKNGRYVTDPDTGKIKWEGTLDIIQTPQIYLTSLASVCSYIQKKLWADLKASEKEPRIKKLSEMIAVAQAIEERMAAIHKELVLATGTWKFIMSKSAQKKLDKSG